MAHSSIRERTERVRVEVPPNEGNEVRGDGHQEVVAPHSTDEAGEAVPRDPVEGRKNRKGCLTLGLGPRHTSEASNSELRVTETTLDSAAGMPQFAAWRIQRQMNRMR